MYRREPLPAARLYEFIKLDHRYLSLYRRQSLYHRIRRLPHSLIYRAIMLTIVLVSLVPIFAIRYTLRTFAGVRQSSFTRLITYPYEAVALSKCLRLVDKCADIFVGIEECLSELFRLIYADA